jgi:hypothetical protein
VPGNTPYVRNDAELQNFLRLIEQYCEYFFGVCGGEGTSAPEIWGAHRVRSSAAPDPIYSA